jgi:predicted Zn-dependent protease
MMKLRNGAEALALAKQHELTKRQDTDALDTLAAAQAETGHFVEAVTVMQEAIKVAGKGRPAAAVTDIRSRMELYHAGRPYREAEKTQP